MNKMWIMAVAGCIGVAAVTLADEVQFKSGDRLTGTVKSMADGKMLFDSKVAGPLVLKMDDIDTFSTDAPIEIALSDGSIVNKKVSPSEGGQVSIEAGRTLPFGNIAKLNPDKPAWKGIVSAGATFVRGNTKSDTASVGVEAPTLPGMDDVETSVADVWATGISPESYPTQCVRDGLDAAGVVTVATATVHEAERRVAVAGVVTHRQRPGTARGVTFLSLEDETGLLNVVCSPGLWSRFRQVARTSAALVVRGRLERAGS